MAASEKIEHENVNKRHSHHHHHHHGPHDRKQHDWVELVRVYRLAVDAAAACCCYCGHENTPPPNEARAIRREGRRAKPDGAVGRRGNIVSAQGGTCSFWPRGWLILGAVSNTLHAPTNRVDINTFDSSGRHCSNLIFMARLSL